MPTYIHSMTFNSIMTLYKTKKKTKTKVFRNIVDLHQCLGEDLPRKPSLKIAPHSEKGSLEISIRRVIDDNISCDDRDACELEKIFMSR